MTANILSVEKNLEKRVCQRIELNKPVQLTFSNGQIVDAITDNISLGGLSILMQNVIDNKPGERISIQLKDTNGKVSSAYECTIVRRSGTHIYVELDKQKAASFGLMLTRGTLKMKYQ